MMKIFTIIHLVFVINYLQGQDHETVLLNKSELSFPYKRIPNQDVVYASTLYPSDRQGEFPGLKKNQKISYFISTIGVLLPNNKYIYLSKNPFRQELKIGLISSAQTKNISIIFDENNNDNFEDDPITHAVIGKHFYKKISVQIDSTDSQFFDIPLEIVVKPSGDEFSIDLLNLMKFDFRKVLDDSILELELLTNSWEINFKHSCINLASGLYEEQNFRLREPFYFNNHWYMLSELDLIKSTIQLYTYEDSIKIYGFREGYYVNLEYLRLLSTLTDQKMLNTVYFNNNYLLLYFWGPWCRPCLEHLDEHQRLSINLSKSNMIHLINYVFMLLENDESSFEELSLNNKLPYPQIFQSYKGGYFKKGTEEDEVSNVLDLLKVSTFPEYVLLDPEGKILYRGNNSDMQLDKLMLRLNILR